MVDEVAVQVRHLWVGKVWGGGCVGVTEKRQLTAGEQLAAGDCRGRWGQSVANMVQQCNMGQDAVGVKRGPRVCQPRTWFCCSARPEGRLQAGRELPRRRAGRRGACCGVTAI